MAPHPVAMQPVPSAPANLLSTFSLALQADEPLFHLAEEAAADLAKTVQNVKRTVRAEWDRADDGRGGCLVVLRLADSENLPEGTNIQSFSGAFSVEDLGHPLRRGSGLLRVWRNSLCWRSKELWRDYRALPPDIEED